MKRRGVQVDRKIEIIYMEEIMLHFKKIAIVLIITTFLTGLVYAKSTYGPKTENIMKIYESGTFQMKATMRAEDESVELEMYVKDNMIAMIMSAGPERMRVVQRDNKSYIINDRERQIVIAPVEDEAVHGIVDTEEIRFISSGTANFNGKNYTYEEYLSDADRMLFFVDGNKLVGIRTIAAEVGTVDMVVHSFESFVPEVAFQIPTGYEVHDLTEFIGNEDFLRIFGE